VRLRQPMNVRHNMHAHPRMPGLAAATLLTG
jgi:hypothetical protein